MQPYELKDEVRYEVLGVSLRLQQGYSILGFYTFNLLAL